MTASCVAEEPALSHTSACLRQAFGSPDGAPAPDGTNACSSSGFHVCAALAKCFLVDKDWRGVVLPGRKSLCRIPRGRTASPTRHPGSVQPPKVRMTLFCLLIRPRLVCSEFKPASDLDHVTALDPNRPMIMRPTTNKSAKSHFYQLTGCGSMPLNAGGFNRFFLQTSL